MARFSGGKNLSENKMCFLIFTTNVWNNFFVLGRTQRDIINLHLHSYKLPVILVGFANFCA